MHIAFLTPEFPTALRTGGGLGSYVGRISRTLERMGHDVEVFTHAKAGPDVIDYHGVRVEHLPLPSTPRRQSWLGRGCSWLVGAGATAAVRGAAVLADALERRERNGSFDFVQCSDYGLAGLSVPTKPGRRFVVRSSSPMEEYRRLNRVGNRPDHLRLAHLETRCVERADLAYAPSNFVANYYRERYGIPMAVVRPPFFFEARPSDNVSFELPDRYLVHFGNINRVKGSDVLAAALRLVWRQAPDFTMVWAGTVPRGRQPCKVYSQLRKGGNRFVWLGALTKPDVYAVVRRAVATVAPSRCDNLPNSVIESLALGVPVIGSRGASIDELVEHGVSGALVPIGDPIRLSNALLRAWHGTAPFDGNRFPLHPIFEAMQPRRAAENLLRLAGLERLTAANSQANGATKTAMPAASLGTAKSETSIA